MPVSISVVGDGDGIGEWLFIGVAKVNSGELKEADLGGEDGPKKKAGVEGEGTGGGTGRGVLKENEGEGGGGE